MESAGAFRALCLESGPFRSRFVVSHPSDKNKNVARVGHPALVADRQEVHWSRNSARRVMMLRMTELFWNEP